VRYWWNVTETLPKYADEFANVYLCQLAASNTTINVAVIFLSSDQSPFSS
jgi:hypothetical protein